ncbi:MAG: DUF559 domain-containing protein [Jatrophihabitans sp.]|uniref:DUF559 domain-containing protein n=1 Tax=Jatrophihabitans sp. TaxID=1932789 RepID=UPI003F81A278
MRDAIDRLLARSGRAASRARLLEVVSRNQLDDEVARGHLVTPFPRVHCRPWDADDLDVLELAGVLSVGRPAALSHTSGLRRYELPVAVPDDRVQVTTHIGRHPIGRSPDLVVHRTRVPTAVRLVRGVPTVEPAVAVTRSWPLLVGPDQRAAAITAVRSGLLTAGELAAAAERAVGMPGRKRLLELTTLLDAGCESELEIWGYLGVFDVPGLRHMRRQRVITVDGRQYRLDGAFEDEQVAIELDGERYHSTRAQRERDRRRDAALATIDWLTLRYSHERLHDDARGCRRDTLRTLAAREGHRRRWSLTG